MKKRDVEKETKMKIWMRENERERERGRERLKEGLIKRLEGEWKGGSERDETGESKRKTNK